MIKVFIIFIYQHWFNTTNTLIELSLKQAYDMPQIPATLRERKGENVRL